MNLLRGIILIDPFEIVMKIYQQVERDNWQSLFESHYSLGNYIENIQEITRVIETIKHAFAEVDGLGIDDWKIYMRGLDPKVNYEISEAIELNVETITPKKEQEYIYQALIGEETKNDYMRKK